MVLIVLSIFYNGNISLLINKYLSNKELKIFNINFYNIFPDFS